MPVLLVSGLAGWFGAHSFLDGIFPAKSARGTAIEELQLRERLLSQKVSIAAGNYWVAYRLSLIFGENPVVVPSDFGAIRYLPHWEALEKAHRIAVIFSDEQDSKQSIQSETADIMEKFPSAVAFRTGPFHGYVFDSDGNFRKRK